MRKNLGWNTAGVFRGSASNVDARAHSRSSALDVRALSLAAGEGAGHLVRRDGRTAKVSSLSAAAVSIFVAGALALTGCVDTTVESSDPPQPTSLSSPPPQQEDGTELPSDDGEVIPVPEAESDTKAAASAVAENVVATFGQPTLDAAAWLEQMTPQLSPTGYEAYTGTDPAQIPVTQVSGPGRVLPASTDVSLIVEVPTNAGAYNVTLTRSDASAPWLAERIRPAQG